MPLSDKAFVVFAYSSETLIRIYQEKTFFSGLITRNHSIFDFRACVMVYNGVFF